MGCRPSTRPPRQGRRRAGRCGSPAPRPAGGGASAGRAVLFAGATVAIGVSGLAFFGLDLVTKLGIGSALGVLTTVLLANSMLISVLRLLGHQADRLQAAV